MLNAIKSVLADISSVSPSSEQREGSILTVVHRPQASKNTNGPLSVSVASPGGQWKLSVKIPWRLLITPGLEKSEYKENVSFI